MTTVLSGQVKDVLRSPAFSVSLLFVATLVLILWQHFGMNRHFQVFPSPQVPHYSISDDALGGMSEARSYVEDGILWLDCTIQKDYQWPFCQLDFPLSQERISGFNGRQFDEITLDILFEAPQADEKIRVFIRTYDERYSQADRYDTLMPNQIEYSPAHYDRGLTLSLDYFLAATWWLSEMNLPLEQQRPVFEHITDIQISTGSTVSEGIYKIGVREISLQGKWLSSRTLYLSLLIIWSLHALYWLAGYFYGLKQTVRHERLIRGRLEELNQVLELSNQRLENAAIRDELTGLLNRHGLRNVLVEYFKSEQCESLSVVLMDIDHFKPVNDTYGHLVGDAILKQFAEIVGREIRGKDKLVRWGGEEFLLLCPQTNEHQAKKLAEKLRTVIEQHRWPHSVPLTASFGVAQLADEQASDLIVNADKALYRAKHSGRNCVVASQNLEPVLEV